MNSQIFCVSASKSIHAGHFSLLSITGIVAGGSRELIANGSWSVAGNWSPAIPPSASDGVLIRASGWAVIPSNARGIKSQTIGNAAAEGSLNLQSGGVLQVWNPGRTSIWVTGPAWPYPGYFNHSAARVWERLPADRFQLNPAQAGRKPVPQNFTRRTNFFC